jgi:hypothetical protein
MLALRLWPQLTEAFPVRLLFQQDGAPPPYNFIVREFLDEQLPEIWIWRGGTTPWPPRSPDVTTLLLLLLLLLGFR